MNSDASFNAEVLRYDDPCIIAMDRQRARMLGVRLSYNASGYAAGTVIARNTTSGLWQAYSNSGSSGLDEAAAILEKPVAATDFPGTTEHSLASSALVHAIFGGVVYYDRLTGIDSNGVTDLKGRVVVDAAGVNLLMFGNG